MPITFTTNRYVPYRVQALGDDLREVVERHRRENPALSDQEIYSGMQVAVSGLGSTLGTIAKVRKASAIVAAILLIVVGLSVGRTAFKVYKAIHGHQAVEKAFTGR